MANENTAYWLYRKTSRVKPIKPSNKGQGKTKNPNNKIVIRRNNKK